MSRQTTVDSMLLSVAAGQPSDSIAIVCSNESTFLARPRCIKSSEIMSRQSTVDSLFVSVAAGQPSDSIAIVCSNESTFLAKSACALRRRRRSTSFSVFLSPHNALHRYTKCRWELVWKLDINIQGDNLERVNTLGATLAENGDLDAELSYIIQSG